MNRLAALGAALTALLMLPAAVADAAPRRGPARPVVVELFSAQGCASCPTANRMLGEIAERRGVIALTYSVDYWDYLGWRDTLAMPEFTTRQRAYVPRLKLKEIYTPEAVVGGRRETPAVDQDKLESLLTAEARLRSPAPSLGFDRRRAKVVVGAGQAPRGGAEVWLVRYDPVRREVKVRTGDNAGKTVTVFNGVRELVRLGAWNGRARSYSLPDPPSGPDLRAVALVQAKSGGPILAAARD